MRSILPLRGCPVRMRLALWNVGVLALALAMFGVALRYTNQNKLTQEVDRALRDRANRLLGERFARDDGLPPPHPRGPRRFSEWAMGERGPDGWMPGEPPPGRRHFDDWGPGGPPPRREPFRARYFDRAGRPVGGPNGERPWDSNGLTEALRGLKPVYSTTDSLRRPVRVLSVPVRRDGQVTGVAQLALPLTDVYEELGRLTRTQLTLIPLALLVAALGGLFLTERALRPVRQITQAAARIGGGDGSWDLGVGSWGPARSRVSPSLSIPNSQLPTPNPCLSERLPVEGHDELSELAATFNEMLGRLEQAFMQLALALEQQRRFTADASHELRTPLTIIKAHTSLALEEERTNREYRQALVAADRAADTTTRIVQDLLLLARADVGQLRPEKAPGSARRLTPIREVLEAAAEAFQGPDHAPILIQAAAPQAVPGDPTHLTRLFSNLFENAVRHTPPTGRILVSVGEEREGLAVRVADTGEGIPPEHLPHVCERFYRIDAARDRRQGGTGLGLAICQSIVQSHGGSLTIESVVGQGTTVMVLLPGPVSSEAESAVSDPLSAIG